MSSVLEPVDVQLKRLYQAAQEYRAKGYRVVVGPSQRELPEFLQGFEPDLIAFSDTDNVVIEVKARRSLILAKTLAQMAAAVEQQPEWRLELILVESETVEEGQIMLAGSLTELLDRARASADSEMGVVLACAAAEQAMFVAAQRAGLSLPMNSTAAALKTLFAYGLLTTPAYEQLSNAVKMRNAIMHGGRSDDPRRWVEAIVPIAETLAA
jgi:hypothetical protein